jgi:hypothetical protein
MPSTTEGTIGAGVPQNGLGDLVVRVQVQRDKTVVRIGIDLNQLLRVQLLHLEPTHP